MARERATALARVETEREALRKERAAVGAKRRTVDADRKIRETSAARKTGR